MVHFPFQHRVRQFYQCHGGTFVPDPSKVPNVHFFQYMHDVCHMIDHHLLGIKPHSVTSMAGEKRILLKSNTDSP